MLDKIERIREQRGLKQYELEQMAGLSRKRITKWKDVGEPTARQALRIARVLSVPVEWLCDDDAPDEPPPIEPTSRKYIDDCRGRFCDRIAVVQESFGKRPESPGRRGPLAQLDR